MREEPGNWSQLSLASLRVGCETLQLPTAASLLTTATTLVKVQEQVAAVSQTCTSNPLLDLRLTTEGSEDQN